MLKPGSPNWTRLNARSLFVCEDREIVSSLRTGKSCFVSYLRKIVTPRPGNRFVSSLRAGKSFRFVSFRFIMEGDLDRCSKHDRCVMDLFFLFTSSRTHTHRPHQFWLESGRFPPPFLVLCWAGFRPSLQQPSNTMAGNLCNIVKPGTIDGIGHCNLCNIDKPGKDMQDHGRCFECNPLRCCILRLKKEDADIATHSENMSKFDRAQFYLDNRGKCKEDVRLVINTRIKQTLLKSREVTLVGNGAYLDEVDLKNKYKDKPGIADKIMARTKSFKCNLTDLVMYEDMEYKTQVIQTTKRTYEETHEMEQEEVDKKPKKAKTGKGIKDKDKENQPPGEAAVVVVTEKKFTTAQINNIEKIATVYTKLVADLAEISNTIDTDELAPFVPKHLTQKLEADHQKLEVDGLSRLNFN